MQDKAASNKQIIGNIEMSKDFQITFPNGMKLKSEIPHKRLWEKAVEHYGQGHSNLWECPCCGGDIDALCDEHEDGLHYDTWRCEGDCDLLITFVTPAEYTEYHQVMDSEWEIILEAGTASNEYWYMQDEKDDIVDPAQLKLFLDDFSSR